MTATRRISFLLDSNIWMDNYDGARPLCGDSRDLIDYCLKEDIGMLYASISIKDVYYSMKRVLRDARSAAGLPLDEAYSKSSHIAAMACIENMSDIATATPLDMSDVWLAKKLISSHPDFEDNLIMAAVERSGADYLVTNDEKLIKHSPYPAMTPKDALKMLMAVS